MNGYLEVVDFEIVICWTIRVRIEWLERIVG